MFMNIKKIGFYLIICKFELLYNDLTFDFKNGRLYNIQPYYYLRRGLTSKIQNFTVEAPKFSQISEMSFTFITSLNNITYENYFKPSKAMLGWRLLEKIARNSKPMKTFERTLSHPLTREFSNVDLVKTQDRYMELIMWKKNKFLRGRDRETIKQCEIVRGKKLLQIFFII